MLLGNGPDCSPQGFNGALYWLLSVIADWIRTRTWFCVILSNSAKKNGLAKSNLCLERAVIPTDLGVEQVSCISHFLHFKNPVTMNDMPQNPIYPISQWLCTSWITVGLKMSYRSPIKCHHPAVTSWAMLVCWCVLAYRAMQKGFARVKMWKHLCKLSAGWMCFFFLLPHFVIVSLLNYYVYNPETTAHHQQTLLSMLGSSLSPLWLKKNNFIFLSE